jgi:hypothetical protein
VIVKVRDLLVVAFAADMIGVSVGTLLGVAMITVVCPEGILLLVLSRRYG